MTSHNWAKAIKRIILTLALALTLTTTVTPPPTPPAQTIHPLVNWNS